MGYYFEDLEKQADLKAIIDSWAGTPFRHWAGVKGEGCDCIHFVARVFEEMGFGPFKIESYNKDWHIHNPEELLLLGLRRELKKHFTIEELPAAKVEPMNGDIVVYRFGRAASHSAIYYDMHVYQSITGVGVERRHWNDKQWHKRKFLTMRLKYNG